MCLQCLGTTGEGIWSTSHIFLPAAGSNIRRNRCAQSVANVGDRKATRTQWVHAAAPEMYRWEFPPRGVSNFPRFHPWLAEVLAPPSPLANDVCALMVQWGWPGSLWVWIRPAIIAPGALWVLFSTSWAGLAALVSVTANFVCAALHQL